MRQYNNTQIVIAITAVLLASVIANVAVGIGAVIFPLTLQANGISTSLIGICLSMEIGAVLLVTPVLNKIVSRIGLGKTLFIATILRAPVFFLLPHYTNFFIWCGLVLVYGIGYFMFLISLQTFLSALPFTRNRGLVIGLFGTSISGSMALGPVILQFIPIHGSTPFYVSAVLAIIAFIPLLLVGRLIPPIPASATQNLIKLIKKVPAVMGASLFGGIMFFGLTYFLVIYGLRNGLEAQAAAFLLTMFMTGSILLEMPIASISDRFDRRYVIMISVLLNLICATYLPIAIYTDYLSWILLIVWGGVCGGTYSVALAVVGERFRGDDLVAANSAFTLMNNTGGVIGMVLVGISMHLFGSDGLPYIIVMSGIIYFTYALTRYRVN